MFKANFVSKEQPDVMAIIAIFATILVLPLTSTSAWPYHGVGAPPSAVQRAAPILNRAPAVPGQQKGLDIRPLSPDVSIRSAQTSLQRVNWISCKFRLKMEYLIRRIFTPGLWKCTALRTDSSFGASQEYLLSNHSVENKAYLSGNDSEPHASLAHLGENLVLRISSLLDEVSLLCLKNTNARFRDIIKIKEKQFSQCVRWRMLTLLEQDLLGKGDSLPDSLACMYCKQTHARADFGVRNGNAGYGIERLYLMEACGPDARFCWRYIPNLLDYTARIEYPEVENHDLPPFARLTDRWVSAYRPIAVTAAVGLILTITTNTAVQPATRNARRADSRSSFISKDTDPSDPWRVMRTSGS
jgi:hypothetical protein